MKGPYPSSAAAGAPGPAAAAAAVVAPFFSSSSSFEGAPAASARPHATIDPRSSGSGSHAAPQQGVQSPTLPQHRRRREQRREQRRQPGRRTCGDRLGMLCCCLHSLVPRTLGAYLRGVLSVCVMCDAYASFLFPDFHPTYVPTADQKQRDALGGAMVAMGRQQQRRRQRSAAGARMGWWCLRTRRTRVWRRMKNRIQWRWGPCRHRRGGRRRGTTGGVCGCVWAVIVIDACSIWSCVAGGLFD